MHQLLDRIFFFRCKIKRTKCCIQIRSKMANQKVTINMNAFQLFNNKNTNFNQKIKYLYRFSLFHLLFCFKNSLKIPTDFQEGEREEEKQRTHSIHF